MSLEHTIRRFEPARDSEAVARIMMEVGWQRPGEKDERLQARRRFQEAAAGFVADAGGEPQCYVSTMPGSYQYRDGALPFAGVTGVITSRVARKQGLASRTTARALAYQAHEGAVVAGLGIFDQGFYNKLGFGTTAYDIYATIDPASLNVPYCRRRPVRLTAADLGEMHEARLRRRLRHGSVSLDDEAATLMGVSASETGFGLGFRDEETGELTHCFWVSTDNPGSGPYRVLWTSFTTVAQFVELLGLLRNFGDQVYTVWLPEPSGVQLQDFLDRPFRRREQSRRGEHETSTTASAGFQYRIMDVPAAMAAAAGTLRGRGTSLPSFTMRVTDPVARYLPEEAEWNGCAGVYRFGPDGAEAVNREQTDVDLEIGIGDLTRAWLGVLPVSTLRDTSDVTVDDDLAAALDDAFAGPAPHTDWFY